MRHIPGIDRSQVLLLPEAVDDYVGRDNPVRFIDAFVDGLDLAAAGFERAAPKATGRPGYDPADLLKLYIYGYLNRVRSSRRLEAESKRNLEVIWLLRRLSPDFKTIADFRRINRAAFRQVFRVFVRLCRELELVGRELVAVDGTRIKAVNSRKRNFTKAKLAKALAESDERLSRYLDRLDEADGQDEGGTGGGEVEHIQEKIAAIQGRRERFEEHRDALAASGEGQLSLTDPDSRAMHAETRIGVGYNIQIAVDAKHKLIAEQQVHNKVSDLGLLAETAVAARRNLAVDRIDAVADAGYFKIEDIEACENAGVMPHVPKPQRGSTVSQGLFPKERFRYDGGEDIYICPNGQRLALHSKRKRRDLFFASYANRAACKECQLKSKCTKSAFRRVLRYVDEAILERMAERLAARPELLDARRESVEHPFGSIKQWMGQGAFLTRRLENVRGEFSITALAYNIRRAISLVGVPALIAAARAWDGNQAKIERPTSIHRGLEPLPRGYRRQTARLRGIAANHGDPDLHPRHRPSFHTVCIVKDCVRERRLRSREVFVPLVHSPGHAQADFGEAMAVIGGVARKLHFLAFDLPHSDGCFVAAYPAETTEAFCDGHNAAFAFFGGVPISILYDNTKLAVVRILGDGKRQRTRVFTELQSHYLFEDRFGRPGKGNDKGKVEGLVGFIRRNFLVPVPRAESFEALNDALAGQCRRRQMARLRGHGETIGERLARDRQALLPLPPAPYDACDKRPGRVSSLSLVRYRDNDYSVPVAYGYREVVIRGYVDQVVIGCGAEVIARHRRSYEREDLIFDPLHYLPLIEQKIGALDQAAPLAGWDLPEVFATLRRLMEARMGKAGKREYVQVLRLLESFRLAEVEAAIGDALKLGAIGFDAVKHLVLCRIERRPPRLDLDVYPYLPKARVATTSARSYMSLLPGAGT